MGENCTPLSTSVCCCHASRKFNRQHQRNAFTLIELLVVISIISLLITILLPSLGKAMIMSRMSMSLANIRQLEIGILNYSEDNKTSLPFCLFTKGGGSPPSTSSYPTWCGELWYRSYITTTAVYWSPARNKTFLNMQNINTNKNDGDWIYAGYGANTEAMPSIHESLIPNFDPINLTDTGKPPLHTAAAKCPQPSRFLLLAETWSNTTSGFNPDKGMAGWYRIQPFTIFTSPNQVTWCLYNYNGAVPRGYLDGHAIAGDGNELGWNCGLVGPVSGTSITRYEEYGGNWSSSTSWNLKAPWYTNWWK